MPDDQTAVLSADEVKASIRATRDALEAAQIKRAEEVGRSDAAPLPTSRRRRGRANAPTLEPMDLGPRVQRKNKRLEVRDDATDPDRPNGLPIRRAQANPHYTQLQRKGGISLVQWMACDAYAYTVERRDGARWVNGERVGGSSTNPAFRGHPTMTQVQASARLTRAHAVLGGDAAALLQLFVVQDLSFTELARRRKESDEVVKGRVLSAIGRLVEHWGMGEKKATNTA